MAIKGYAVIDGIQWEGEETIAIHVVYVGLASTNTHSPEVYGLMLVEGLSHSVTQATLDQTLKNAVKAKLIDDHGFSFGPLDSIRLIGSSLTL